MTSDVRLDARKVALAAATTVAALALTTALASVLRTQLGVPNAEAVYLLAVVGIAVAFGTVAAAAAALGAFLLYDFLFTQPLFTFTIADPGVLLNALLLLLVGIVVGQLAAGQRNRAEAALAREREARVLFEVSWELATREDRRVAFAEIVETIRAATSVVRVWITLGGDGSVARVAADSGSGAAAVRGTAAVVGTAAGPATYRTLRRAPGDAPAKWIRVHDPRAAGRAVPKRSGDVYRAAIEADGRPFGALWLERSPGATPPPPEETRMLGSVVDQVGQALELDRLRTEATSAELARRSDALKTALLDSVSHDLRTPLASIRAAAGSLMDPVLRWTPEQIRLSASTIDREAERLNRLVTNLLDMSRIEAGGLRPELEAYALDDLAATTVRRLRGQLAARDLDVAVPADLPLVEVDATFMDQILTNLIENAARYTPADSLIRLSAKAGAGSGRQAPVRLSIEDSGPGVPEDALPRLFEKFYRVPRPGEGSRRGSGIGLAVVRGLVEAMGGQIQARRSELGGLAIDVDLPTAPPTPEDGSRHALVGDSAGAADESTGAAAAETAGAI